MTPGGDLMLCTADTYVHVVGPASCDRGCTVRPGDGHPSPDAAHCSGPSAGCPSCRARLVRCIAPVVDRFGESLCQLGHDADEDGPAGLWHPRPGRTYLITYVATDMRSYGQQ